jgi:hypothetical protein
MQVHRCFAGSMWGFKSPFAHQCDELQISRPWAGELSLMAAVVSARFDVAAAVLAGFTAEAGAASAR